MITPTINTVTRQRVQPTAPDPKTITPEDIAAGLAHRYRFGGQAGRPLTVAQHSLAVADRLPPTLELAGLLHDAPEAYLPDLARPLWPVVMLYLPFPADEDEAGDEDGLQYVLAPFGAAHHRLAGAIAERLGLAWPRPFEETQAISVVDDRQMATEIRDCGTDPTITTAAEPYPERITRVMDPATAGTAYLRRLCRLTKRAG